MADTTTVIGLLGFVDNFDEPKPSWNEATTIVPTVIVFLVSIYGSSLPTACLDPNFPTLGLHLYMCDSPPIHAVHGRPRPGVG